MATVVVTGGQGFVGQYLTRDLSTNGWEVVTWDLPQVDITQAKTWQKELKKLKPAWLIHLAALTNVGESFNDQAAVHQVNVDGTVTLLQSIQQISPATKVLVASSADIYGEAAKEKKQPLVELPLAQAKPQNPYGRSKLEMEKIIESEFLEQTIRVRPFPHIGPKQKLGFVSSDFASQIAAIEKGEKKPVLHVGNLEAIRDFSDVRDVVRAYRLLLENGQLGEVYHVASGVGTKISDLLEMLLSQSAVAISIEHDENKLRPSDISQLVGSAAKLHEAVGWKPEIELEQTLVDILSWWRQN